MRSEFSHFDAQVTLPLYTFEQLRLHTSMQVQTLIVLKHTLLRHIQLQLSVIGAEFRHLKMHSGH